MSLTKIHFPASLDFYGKHWTVLSDTSLPNITDSYASITLLESTPASPAFTTSWSGERVNSITVGSETFLYLTTCFRSNGLPVDYYYTGDSWLASMELAGNHKRLILSVVGPSKDHFIMLTSPDGTKLQMFRALNAQGSGATEDYGTYYTQLTLPGDKSETYWTNWINTTDYEALYDSTAPWDFANVTRWRSFLMEGAEILPNRYRASVAQANSLSNIASVGVVGKEADVSSYGGLSGGIYEAIKKSYTACTSRPSTDRDGNIIPYSFDESEILASEVMTRDVFDETSSDLRTATYHDMTSVHLGRLNSFFRSTAVGSPSEILMSAYTDPDHPEYIPNSSLHFLDTFDIEIGADHLATISGDFRCLLQDRFLSPGSRFTILTNSIGNIHYCEYNICVLKYLDATTLSFYCHNVGSSYSATWENPILVSSGAVAPGSAAFGPDATAISPDSTVIGPVYPSTATQFAIGYQPLFRNLEPLNETPSSSPLKNALFIPKPRLTNYPDALLPSSDEIAYYHKGFSEGRLFALGLGGYNGQDNWSKSYSLQDIEFIRTYFGDEADKILTEPYCITVTCGSASLGPLVSIASELFSFERKIDGKDCTFRPVTRVERVSSTGEVTELPLSGALLTSTNAAWANATAKIYLDPVTLSKWTYLAGTQSYLIKNKSLFCAGGTVRSIFSRNAKVVTIPSMAFLGDDVSYLFMGLNSANNRTSGISDLTVNIGNIYCPNATTAKGMFYHLAAGKSPDGGTTSAANLRLSSFSVGDVHLPNATNIDDFYSNFYQSYAYGVSTSAAERPVFSFGKVYAPNAKSANNLFYRFFHIRQSSSPAKKTSFANVPEVFVSDGCSCINMLYQYFSSPDYTVVHAPIVHGKISTVIDDTAAIQSTPLHHAFWTAANASITIPAYDFSTAANLHASMSPVSSDSVINSISIFGPTHEANPTAWTFGNPTIIIPDIDAVTTASWWSITSDYPDDHLFYLNAKQTSASAVHFYPTSVQLITDGSAGDNSAHACFDSVAAHPFTTTYSSSIFERPNDTIEVSSLFQTTPVYPSGHNDASLRLRPKVLYKNGYTYNVQQRPNYLAAYYPDSPDVYYYSVASGSVTNLVENMLEVGIARVTLDSRLPAATTRINCAPQYFGTASLIVCGDEYFNYKKYATSYWEIDGLRYPCFSPDGVFIYAYYVSTDVGSEVNLHLINTSSGSPVEKTFTSGIKYRNNTHVDLGSNGIPSQPYQPALDSGGDWAAYTGPYGLRNYYSAEPLKTTTGPVTITDVDAHSFIVLTTENL